MIKQKKMNGSKKNEGPDQFLGEKLKFSATEAYKLLRTNLFFCLPEGNDRACPVVGVTSSVQGEGKSTTSINLAYMLAENGKRVCLIEGDLRAPTFKSRLKLKNAVGLSHVLANMEADLGNLLTNSLHKNLWVVSAGDIPPNPAELLGSARMEHFIGVLKEGFSYIVLDLPPITVVADALAVSGVLDGMLVVVEEGKTTKRELADAMQRLEMIHDKILGFVITHAERTKGKYGKKYGKKYRYGYGYGYGYGGKRSESDPARSDSSDD